MMPCRPKRRGEEAVEWMDAGEGTEAQVAEAYGLLHTVNHRLAGFRSTFRALEDLGLVGAGTGPAGITILDVAGGSGDFAARLAAWGRTGGDRATVWLLDLNPVALALAAGRGHPGVVPLKADALALPFPDRSFDLVHCATFFHHLSTLRARDLLAEMCRVSRRLVLVNDLVRSWVALGAIHVLARAATGNHLIRHDGPLSVLKSFTPRELIALAHATGDAGRGFRWRLSRNFPYRMVLAGVRSAP